MLISVAGTERVRFLHRSHRAFYSQVLLEPFPKVEFILRRLEVQLRVPLGPVVERRAKREIEVLHVADVVFFNIFP